MAGFWPLAADAPGSFSLVLSTRQFGSARLTLPLARADRRGEKALTHHTLHPSIHPSIHPKRPDGPPRPPTGHAQAVRLRTESGSRLGQQQAGEWRKSAFPFPFIQSSTLLPLLRPPYPPLPGRAANQPGCLAPTGLDRHRARRHALPSHPIHPFPPPARYTHNPFLVFGHPRGFTRPRFHLSADPSIRGSD